MCISSTNINTEKNTSHIFNPLKSIKVRVHSRQGEIKFLGRNKISQGQEIVREFYQLSGKFWHWEKLMKNVMEFHRMSGKMTILDDATLQSPHISIN